MLVTAYLNGSTAGTPPPPRRHPHVKRGVVKGWTADAVRRHTKWLYSVDAPALDGVGFALTLTVRDCPETAAEWTAARTPLLKRLSRAGMIRSHWLTEWQRRGVPHLHAAVYFPPGTRLADVLALVMAGWQGVAGHWGVGLQSQDVKKIAGTSGWLQYLSKHASRGVKHYQRNGHPAGWVTTGRLWGVGGVWPTEEPFKFDLSRPAGHRYRRMIRAWTLADARKSGCAGRIRWAKKMLACNDRKLSSVRGVSGWVPESVTLSLIALLAEQGEGVIQRVEEEEESQQYAA